MSDQNIDSVIAKIEKLLALGQNNDNEHQAAAAMAKVQAMLEEYNLDMSVLGKSGKGTHQARKVQTGKGGLYSWQRKLWKAVAELNFCHYLSIKGLAKGSVYEHRLIGSRVNVISTEVMAKYLQQAIERLAQQWAKDNSYKSVFVREAIAYREGMAARLVDKLQHRRYEILDAEKAKEQQRKRDEAASGIVTSNAMTLVSVISTELDFNNDYLNGWELGTTAQNRHDNEINWKKYQAEQEEKKRAWEAWAKANPEAAARKLADAMRQKQADDAAWKKKYGNKVYKERYRKPTPEEERAGLGSYREGYRKGADVGIDTQVDQTTTRRIA